MFEDSRLYRQINSEAHRYRSTDIRAPTLVWHMGFLIANPPGHDFDETRRVLKHTLNAGVVLLLRRLRERFADPTDANGRVEGWSRILPQVENLVLLFDHVYEDRGETLHVQRHPRSRHADIVKIDQRAIFIKFPWNDAEIVVRIQLQTEHFTVTVFAQVPSGHVAHTGTQPDPNRPCHLRSIEDLADGFWESYKSFLFSLPGVRAMFDDPIFAHVFADLRGIVVSDETVYFPDRCFKSPTHQPTWAAALAQAIRPLLSSGSRYECSASYLLDGRALLATTFGPQRPEHPDEQRLPLTFVLCVHQEPNEDVATGLVNSRQLGRLVDRFLLVATLKLAALIDIGLLRTASRHLAQLDAGMKNARTAVEVYEHNHSASAQTRDALETARHALNRVSIEFLDDPDNIYRAGLTYRVEASRYYVTSAATIMPALRIGRVEGFQPFDQYIDRRLGPSYDFIDRLGIRYERAANGMSWIDQAFTTIQAGHSGTAIVEIQKYGEIILLFFILPYYVISTWTHIGEMHTGIFQLILAFGVYALYVIGCLKAYLFFKRKAMPLDAMNIAVRGGSFALVAFVIVVVMMIGPYWLHARPAVSCCRAVTGNADREHPQSN